MWEGPRLATGSLAHDSRRPKLSCGEICTKIVGDRLWRAINCRFPVQPLRKLQCGSSKCCLTEQGHRGTEDKSTLTLYAPEPKWEGV